MRGLAWFQPLGSSKRLMWAVCKSLSFLGGGGAGFSIFVIECKNPLVLSVLPRTCISLRFPGSEAGGKAAFNHQIQNRNSVGWKCEKWPFGVSNALA